MEQQVENAKHLIDGLSIGTVVATLAGWLPSLAALMSVIWTGMRMYEWIKERKHGKQG